MDDAALRARQESLEHELGDAVTVDRLTRDVALFQRRRGHRHSTDDLLTAWYATSRLPAGRAVRLLDLGTGIGSVGLALLWFARSMDEGSRLVAIEAQEVSFRLLRENVEANGLGDVVTMIHGDLRDETLVTAREFDVVTGSPPYFDVRSGIVSADSQRAHARFELRGDVRDYARAAARTMTHDGVFVFCFPTTDRGRAEAACRDAGLAQLSACDVVPRAGRPALFSLFTYARASDGAARQESFVVRDDHGVQTDALTLVRRTFGLV